MLQLSKYCKIVQGKEIFLWHQIYGNPLIITSQTWKLLQQGQIDSLSIDEKKLLTSNNYLVDQEPETSDFYQQIDAGILEGNDFSFIKTAFFIVTNSCNLNCAYCMFRDVADKDVVNLSLEQFKQAISQVIQLHVRPDPLVVTFSGGEPLLRFNFLKEAIDYLTHSYPSQSFEFRILTNATLLKDEIVEFLNKYDFRVHLSIDGLKDEHSRVRKFVTSNEQVSFSGIEIAANYVKQGKLKVEAVQVTICDENFNISPLKLLNWIKTNFNLDRVSIEPDVTNKTMSISPERMAAKIKDFFIAGEELDIEIIGFSIKPYLSLFEHFLERKRLTWCGAVGGSGLVITPENHWKTCAYLDERFGELNDCFSDVLKRWQQWQQRQIQYQRNKCRGCDLEFLCMGGCLVSQKDEAVFQYRCCLYKSFFDLMLQEHLNRE